MTEVSQKKRTAKARQSPSGKNQVLILGSGTSTGIPMIGCDCAVCSSKNKKNKRLRSSVLLKTHAGNSILIDTTPDLRTQFLRHKIAHIDATVLTHDHADHLHGIDDLRPLCFGPPPRYLPIYTAKRFAPAIARRFPYIFDRHKKPVIGGGIPLLNLVPVADKGETTIAGEQFQFFSMPHGHDPSLGLVHGKFAYAIDCHDIPAAVVKNLRARELDLLIIDCLQDLPHKTHLTVEHCFRLIEAIRPKMAGLIHMNHNLEHTELAKRARKHFDFPVFPVYDGQSLTYADA